MQLFISFIVLTLTLSCTKRNSKNKIINDFRTKVFKIYTTSKDPNFVYPWNHRPASQSNGTGFYIGKNEIMTNAHVVANGRYISVQRDGDSQKKVATVKYIGHDCDLAILEIADKEYFKNMKAAKFGKVPKLLSPVTTVGYPVGGEQVSTTDGVVSRLRYSKYTHSGFRQHLMIQVDSAINPGNSGGPVVQNGKVVGVAFQAFTRAQNTGYIIPTPVVKRFLKDIEDGKYDGHPYSGIHTQKWATSNPSLREYLKLKENQQGAYVSYIEVASPAQGIIAPGDIILEIDGSKIGEDGKVDYAGERVNFLSLFDLKMQKEKVKFKIFREGKTQTVETNLKTEIPSYNPGHYYGRYPKFYVYAGMIFNKLTREYLQTWGDKWYSEAPFFLLHLHFYNEFLPDISKNDDIIVYGGKMPHPINTYVKTPRNSVLKSMNGQAISSLNQLKTMIEENQEDFIKLEFFNDVPDTILHKLSSQKAHEEILQGYRINPAFWLKDESVDGAIYEQEKTGVESE